MTRQKKFKVGDLVVLKKDASVFSYPAVPWSGLYSSNTSDINHAKSLISERTNIKYAVDVRYRGRSGIPELKAGAVGIIKGFSNVFMLEHDLITEKTFGTLVSAKKQQTLTIGSNIYLNKFNRKHMQVLIDERLIAFAPGAKLFEKCEDTLARYDSVTVKFEGTLTMNNVNELELRTLLAGRRRQFATAFSSNRIVSVECVRRDGTIEKKESYCGKSVDTEQG